MEDNDIVALLWERQEPALENPVSKLFYFGDKKSSIHFHTKAHI